MKIIHPSGTSYQLIPGTALEITRSNPFFNEHGEQSLPITLPASEHNLMLLKHPNRLHNTAKIKQDDIVTIQNGSFQMQAKQAILSATNKEISTSFYLNEGAFFSKIKNKQLSEIFADKVIKFPSVQNAITFVRNLMITPDPRFACFPTATDQGTLNRIGSTIAADGYYNLHNAEPRIIIENEIEVALSPGYYITPFIKANHLLTEIFAYLGYTLLPSFFTETYPFTDMVFLNNTIDTLVKSEIRYSQIIPDCMATTILELFRTRFCAEFIPHETTKTVSIVLFKDLIKQEPKTNLTKNIASDLIINYPGGYKQLKLTAEEILAPKPETDSKEPNVRPQTNKNTGISEEFSTLLELNKKYPTATINPISGNITRIGYQGIKPITDQLGSINCNYYAGGNLEAHEIKSPDTLIRMMYSGSQRNYSKGRPSGQSVLLLPYIGASRSLNSSIISTASTTDTDTTSSETATTENVELRPMLAFAHHRSTRKHDIGTILNYDEQGDKISDYTLSFNGEFGTFEQFYRERDALLRNSLHECSVDILLSDLEKQNITSFQKILIQNQELLPNEIKYSPGVDAPFECTFFTTKLFAPISEAIPEANRFTPPLYMWKVCYTKSPTGYKYMAYKNLPTVIYLDHPTAEQYTQGGKYHQSTHDVIFGNRSSSSGIADPIDGSITIWFEAVVFVL